MGQFQLTRDLTKAECPWLKADLREGTIVHEYTGHTYGCISSKGIACSRDGGTPFFELPREALESHPCQTRKKSEP